MITLSTIRSSFICYYHVMRHVGIRDRLPDFWLLLEFIQRFRSLVYIFWKYFKTTNSEGTKACEIDGAWCEVKYFRFNSIEIFIFGIFETYDFYFQRFRRMLKFAKKCTLFLASDLMKILSKNTQNANTRVNIKALISPPENLYVEIKTNYCVNSRFIIAKRSAIIYPSAKSTASISNSCLRLTASARFILNFFR